jgi:hypothetical protein
VKLLRPLVRRSEVARYDTNDYASWVSGLMGSFGYQGSQYPLGVNTTLPGTTAESIPNSFTGYVNGGLKGNGIIATLELARLQVFSQARFKWRRFSADGRPGELFGTPALSPLEQPFPGHLLSWMILDADSAGNAYGALVAGQVVRMRPDWCDIVYRKRMTVAGPIGSEMVALIYWDGGQRDQKHPTYLYPGEFMHFAPLQDPLAEFRGMSWMTPIIRDLQGDEAYTRHKTTFVDNAATPNLAVTLKEGIGVDAFNEFVEAMDASHKGPANAGKTLYLAGGADVTVVGADMRQLDYKVVQGAGETRIAAASGVGAVIAQLSEGMQGSSLNAGNYAAARRRFGDMTMRHLWQQACGSLSTVVDAPYGSELWYDARDISFLQEDEKDAAEIRKADASTLRTLLDAGFEPDAAVAFVQTAGDLGQLSGQHSGKFSVQLQQDDSTTPSPTEVPDD